MPFQRCRCFCHLHQRMDALLHSGASGTRENDNWKPFFFSSFYSSRNFLTYGAPHAGHKKPAVHDAERRFRAANPAFSGYYRLFQPGFQPCSRKFFFVSLKFHWISACKLPVPFREAAFICHALNTLISFYLEISSALWAHVIVSAHILRHNDRAALFAFTKQPFRHLRFFSSRSKKSLICFLKYMIQIHSHHLCIFSRNPISTLPARNSG